MGKIVCIIVLFITPYLHAQQYYLLVGTYDSPESEGVHVYSFDSSSGNTAAVSRFKTSNPSFIAVSPDERFVYVVQETASQEGFGGKVKALAFHKQSGTLNLLNEQNTWGDHPCHIVTDQTGKWLFVANYTGGSLSRFPVLPDGSVGPATTVRQSGEGPHTRQQSSHVHGNMISPDNKWLLTTNLGNDKVIVYSFDPETGALHAGNHSEVNAVPGSGPRLSAFHPNAENFYVIEELTGTVSVYDYKKGRLKNIQRTSTMMAGDTSFAGSAHLMVSADGKFLYASNRGRANNIAIYSIDKKGKLHLIEHQSTGGLSPRFFTIDPSGKYLLVANQHSGEIVIFNRDRETGSLSDAGKRIQVGKPVCLQWVSMDMN